jgi:hypothetical protein
VWSPAVNGTCKAGHVCGPWPAEPLAPLLPITATILSDYTSHILPRPRSINVADQTIYWVDQGDILTCPLADCTLPTALPGTAENDLVLRGDR